MPILDSLTLTDARRQKAISREHAYRAKLVDAIDLQIEAAQAELNGEPYRRSVRRWITNAETGQRAEAIVPVRFRQWWWKELTGHVSLEIRYANKTVEIRPNKPTISVGTNDKLIPILQQIRKAVIDGELDKAINAIVAVRKKELRKGAVSSAKTGK